MAYRPVLYSLSPVFLFFFTLSDQLEGHHDPLVQSCAPPLSYASAYALLIYNYVTLLFKKCRDADYQVYLPGLLAPPPPPPPPAPFITQMHGIYTLQFMFFFLMHAPGKSGV